MKTVTSRGVLWLWFTSLATLVAAAEVSLSGNAPSGVLEVSFERQTRQKEVSIKGSRRGKRDKTSITTSFADDHIVHVVNVTIGTPPQPISLVLDTGSSDLIVRSSPSTYCKEDTCVGGGIYNPKKSTSYKHLNNGFASKFGSEADNSSTFAQGDVANETVTIGGTTLKDLQIAVVENATIPLGILGLGLPVLESQAQVFDNATSYDNMPLALFHRGLVKDYGYSIYSEDPTAKKGSILFGGIDTAKFTGKLQTLDVLPRALSTMAGTDITYLTLTVALGGFRLKGNSNSKRAFVLPSDTETSGLDLVPALVDSGTTLTFLPSRFVNPLLEKLAATYVADGDFVDINCKHKDNKAILEFLFPGFSLQIPLQNFIRDLGDNQCSLHILPTKGRDTILGASFLGNVFAAFDLAKYKIHFAARDFESKGTNIKRLSTLWDEKAVKGDGSKTSGSTSTTSEDPTSWSPSSSSSPDDGTGSSESPHPKSVGNRSAKGLSLFTLLVTVIASTSSLYIS